VSVQSELGPPTWVLHGSFKIFSPSLFDIFNLSKRVNLLAKPFTKPVTLILLIQLWSLKKKFFCCDKCKKTQGLAFRVQEILQDGGLFTGDIIVIVIYFIGKRSLKSTRHHENDKETKENEMGEMRRLTQSRLCIICYIYHPHGRAWVSMCKGVPHGQINYIDTKA
jgi:hypothetical protein